MFLHSSTFKRCLFRTYSSSITKVGFVFDIDGVLVRGNQKIKGVTNTLLQLKNRKIPHIFLTNGGGMSEVEKAEQLSRILGIRVDHQQVVLAHTPMKSLVKKYKKDPILVIGNEHIGNVARFYGFEKVVTSQHIFDWNPSVWPFKKPTEQMKELEHTQIAAILMMYDSTDWGHDLQVMLDVLRSDQGRLGTLAKDSKKQSVPLYFSNSDLVWANDFPVDRLAQGSFRLALETLYKKLTGHELEYTKFGKPERVTYEYAAKALQEQADNLGRQVDRIFAVGDNPASDIIGANNHGWSSILVRSGVWKGDTHDHGA